MVERPLDVGGDGAPLSAVAALGLGSAWSPQFSLRSTWSTFSSCSLAVDDGSVHVVNGGADGLSVGVVRQVGGDCLSFADIVSGGGERSQATEIVGDVEIKTRVEACYPESRVILLSALIGECIGGIKRADIPDESLCRVFAEICKVVRERAAMERIAGDSDLVPQSEQSLSS